MKKSQLSTLITFLLFQVSVSYSQTNIWGVSLKSGAHYGGAFFKLDGNGDNFQKMHSVFVANKGREPMNDELIEGDDGKFYGVTIGGGRADEGVLYSYDRNTDTYEVLQEFQGSQYGERPVGGLTLADNGKLYGTTVLGGRNDKGVLFEYDYHNKIYTKKYDFTNGSTGRSVSAKLIQVNNGKLYGVAKYGGSNNDGTIFEYDYINNKFNVLFNFDEDVTGKFPNGRLLQTSTGKLYGTTLLGGANDNGTIYTYDIKTGEFTNVFDFDFYTTGSYASGGLIEAPNGKLYGTTSQGGQNQYDYNTYLPIEEGFLFEFDTVDHSYTKIHAFNNVLDGQKPLGTLFYNAENGYIYGMTNFGGVNNDGVIFRFDPTVKEYEKLKDFDYTYDGAQPQSTFMMTENGKLYATTNKGGNIGRGTLFEFDPLTNEHSVRINFDEALDGSYPNGIVQAANGTVYGIMQNGGLHNSGTLIKIDPYQNTYTKIIDFDNEDLGQRPEGLPIQYDNGKFYGFTGGGGINNCGTIYEFDPSDETLKKVFDFTEQTTGKQPMGQMVQGDNNLLYGVTVRGGSNEDGTLFEFNPITKQLITKHAFNPTDGIMPDQGLVKTTDGKLYGVTYTRGEYGNGTIYEYNITTEEFKTVHSFQESEGKNPQSLVLATNGKIYGTTYLGGSGNGSLFEFDPANYGFKVLHKSTGGRPKTHPIQAANGKLYGTTYRYPSRAVYMNNVIYEYSIENNTYTEKHELNFGYLYDAPLVEIGACKPSSSRITVSECTEYVAPDNQTLAESGYYRSIIQNKAGCDSTIFIDLTIKPEQECLLTDFQNTEKNDITIFPNPASKSIQINGLNEGNSIKLFDIQGRLLISKTASNWSTEIQTNDLKVGIYYIQIDKVVYRIKKI